MDPGCRFWGGIRAGSKQRNRLLSLEFRDLILLQRDNYHALIAGELVLDSFTRKLDPLMLLVKLRVLREVRCGYRRRCRDLRVFAKFWWAR